MRRKLSQCEIERIKKELESIPEELFDLDENYVTEEIDISDRERDFLIALAGSDDERSISLVVNRLLYNLIKSIDENFELSPKSTHPQSEAGQKN